MSRPLIKHMLPNKECKFLRNGRVCKGPELQGLCMIATSGNVAGRPLHIILEFLSRRQHGSTTCVAAEPSHTCAITAESQLRYFGHNSDGQCAVPEGLGAVVAVAAGTSHTCANSAESQLRCSGDPFWTCLTGRAFMDVPCWTSLSKQAYLDMSFLLK